MEKVRLLPFVVFQLNDLIDILYYEEYVGFKKTAMAYVTDLENFIYSIPKRKHKLCRTTNLVIITASTSEMHKQPGILSSILKTIYT